MNKGAQSIRLFIRREPCFLATAHTDSREPVHWSLTSRPRDRCDFFVYAARWSARILGGERNRHRAFTRALEAQLLGRLREPAAAVLGGLDRSVLAAARRFPAALRVRAFGALSRDERGWARQTLSAGVGHLLFAFGLMDVDETVPAGVKLLRDLAEGRKLNDALDEAIAAWGAALPIWGRNVGGWTDDQVRAFHVAAAKAGEERRRMLASQRVLVRRAGPQVDPALLLLPPPLRFAPEDVPATPGANAAWFRVMKVPRVTLEAVGMLHPVPFLQAFGTFASRHAAAIARPPDGITLDLWLEGLCEALRVEERTPLSPNRPRAPSRGRRRPGPARAPDGTATPVSVGRAAASATTSSARRSPASARTRRAAQARSCASSAPAGSAAPSGAPRPPRSHHRRAPGHHARASGARHLQAAVRAVDQRRGRGPTDHDAPAAAGRRDAHGQLRRLLPRVGGGG